MHPSAANLIAEIADAQRVLKTPSGNDETFRALLRELLHSEKVQVGILDWLPKADQQVRMLGEELERAQADLDALRASPPQPLRPEAQVHPEHTGQDEEDETDAA